MLLAVKRIDALAAEPKSAWRRVHPLNRVSFERLMSVSYIYPFRFVTCPRLDRRGKGKERGVERTREDVLLSVAKVGWTHSWPSFHSPAIQRTPTLAGPLYLSLGKRIRPCLAKFEAAGS